MDRSHFLSVIYRLFAQQTVKLGLLGFHFIGNVNTCKYNDFECQSW